MGLQRYTLFFLFLLINIDCGYSIEPPRRGGSNEYPQSMFGAEIWKISVFHLKIFSILEVKFSVYLNRRIFVMWWRTEENCPRIISKHSSLSPLTLQIYVDGSVWCGSVWWSEGRCFDPRWIRHHSFIEIDHKIFSTVILSLSLIQKVYLTVSDERMCTNTG